MAFAYPGDAIYEDIQDAADSRFAEYVECDGLIWRRLQDNETVYYVSVEAAPERLSDGTPQDVYRGFYSPILINNHGDFT